MAALILVFGSFAAADYYQWFKFSDVSYFIFNRGASSSILVILAIALFAFLYYLNYGVIVHGMSDICR